MWVDIIMRKDNNFSRRLLHRLRSAFYFSFVKRKINWNQFNKIRQKYLINEYNGKGPFKYFDYKKYLKINIDRVLELNLHKRPSAEIMDIGCGFGYFLFVCKKLGCEVIGVDFSEGNNLETKCYSDMIDMFALKRIMHRIVKYKKLPLFEKKFDLITAFQVCFNLHNSSERWEKEEWQFFLSDLKTYLKPDGQIYLHFNRRDSDQSFCSDSLKEYFISQGAEVLKNGHIVFFKSTECLSD
jgi:SAM-dependent methyltransferase